MTIEECRERKRIYRRLEKKLAEAEKNSDGIFVIRNHHGEFEALKIALQRSEACEKLNVSDLKRKTAKRGGEEVVKRMIDADRLKDYVLSDITFSTKIKNKLFNLIDSQPTIKAIQCKECSYWGLIATEKDSNFMRCCAATLRMTGITCSCIYGEER